MDTGDITGRIGEGYANHQDPLDRVPLRLAAAAGISQRHPYLVPLALHQVSLTHGEEIGAGDMPPRSSSGSLHVGELECGPVSDQTPDGGSVPPATDAVTDEAVSADMERGDEGLVDAGGAVGPDDDDALGADYDDSDEDDEDDEDDDDDEDDEAAWSPSPHRRAAFAVARALVVLAVAAVGYQAVVPTVHVVRGRLARLVPTKSGVAAFDKTHAQSGEQDATKTGIAAAATATKQSPNRTGLYSIEWSPTQNSVAGFIAFLLPSDSTATTALAQIRTQQLAVGSYSSSSLTRTSTYTVAGVPGSYASVYAPSAKAAGSAPGLVATAFRYGRVVAVSEVASSNATARPDADTMTTGEYANLRHLGTGFSLSVTRRPVVATALWAASAGVLAAIAALVPVVRRRRAQRRRQAYEAEMASRVVIGARVIVKHRR
jgi:hypothetical protein